nr:unnamed protein product [Callosobruchus analis]
MTCVKCSKVINNDESAVSCDSCARMVHRDCSDLSASELRVMDLKGKRVLKYYCEECQMGVKLVPKLIAKVESLKAELKQLQAMVANSRTLPDETIVEEIQERHYKANNIMIFNLPEDVENRSEKDSDMQKVRGTIKDITQDEPRVLKTFRVGKRNKNGFRPLKEVFQLHEDAMIVLRNKKEIKRDRKLFIEPDLTVMQLGVLNKLKSELKERKEKGENVAIRYKNGIPKILNLNLRGPTE